MSPLSDRHVETALEAARVRAWEDVFLDYGCGRGRALLVAAGFPFRRVIGVEIVPALVREARRSAARAGRLSCGSILVEQADAADYELPRDVTVALLFHPFSGATLARVLERVRASLREAPRRFRIAHLSPLAGDDALMRTPWLRPLARLPTGLWDDMRFTLYEA